jgi:hypothetical protein
VVPRARSALCRVQSLLMHIRFVTPICRMPNLSDVDLSHAAPL